ncbi:MAG: uroporphyrinogen-III C-methyltransferase, partial [Pseudomonadota bacterium]
QFWEAALNGQMAERFLEGDEEGALQIAKDMLAGGKPEGVVHIVGAGPGDPELLTLKALRLLQQADIVYYDRLVSDEIIDLIRRDADRVCVGKEKNFHSVPQPKIHDLLVESAREGKRVVRLKGGDPFIFGRGGEELEALQAEGVDAHVVPGISSALGCAASSGIPLTHRDHAQAVTFVTGHAKSGDVPELDWQSLGAANQTLVIFMGLTNASTIAENLIKVGRKPSTPVAIIENGTREDERRFFGSLSEMPQIVDQNKVTSPALLIIGEVAGLPLEAIIRRAADEAA